MEMAIVIDTLVGLVIGGLAYFLGTQAKELKRVEILLNRTREEFVSRGDLRNDLQRITDSLQRL